MEKLKMTKVEKMTNVKKNGQIGQVFFSFLTSKRGGKRGGRPFAKTPFMFDFFCSGVSFSKKA